MYGTQSVDSEEVKLGMAKDLLSAKGMLQGDIPRGVSSLAPLTYRKQEEGSSIKENEISNRVTKEDNKPKDVDIEKWEEMIEEETVSKPIERNMDINKWL